MDIEKVDPNLVSKNENSDNIKFYPIDYEMFDLYGVSYDKEHNVFVRMPYDIAFSVSENIGGLNRCTTGGRIRFKTNSTHIAIRANYDNRLISANSNPACGMGYVIIDETNSKYITNIFPSLNQTKEFSIIRKVSNGEMIDYTIYMPSYHDTLHRVEIGLDKNAKVYHGKKYKDLLPILYYGSSITQGGCSSRPDLIYQSIICKQNNVDFINLGFSGNALAEDRMIEYLSTIKSSVFVCDYDHNAPSVEYLANTHFKLYSAYRKAHPTTPILFLTRPYDPNVEDMLNRIAVIKHTYNLARKNGDRNVYFINGSTIFGKLYDYCTVDNSHPNTLGMYMMAKVIGRKINKILGINDEEF